MCCHADVSILGSTHALHTWLNTIMLLFSPCAPCDIYCKARGCAVTLVDPGRTVGRWRTMMVGLTTAYSSDVQHADNFIQHTVEAGGPPEGAGCGGHVAGETTFHSIIVVDLQAQAEIVHTTSLQTRTRHR